MDERTLDIAATIVDPAYIRQGAQSLATRSAYFRKLVSQRRAPDAKLGRITTTRHFDALAVVRGGVDGAPVATLQRVSADGMLQDSEVLER